MLPLNNNISDKIQHFILNSYVPSKSAKTVKIITISPTNYHISPANIV